MRSLLVSLLGTVGAAEKKNVLFIVADDLRPEMGCFGGEAVTPHIDTLATSPGSVMFDRAYVQVAVCNPTRTSFLTGRRPDSTKVWDLHTQFRESMPGGETVKTLPQYFKDQGYYTAGMGKVFHSLPYKGQRDDIAGGSWSEPYFQTSGEGFNMTVCWTEHDADESLFVDNKLAAHGADILRDAATKQPFFVAVGLHRPHLPWDVPQKYFDLYPEDVGLADHNTLPLDYNITGAQPLSWDPQSDNRHCLPLGPINESAEHLPGEFDLVPDDTAKKFRRAYFAAVSQTDANVGTVLAELDSLGLTSNTVVILLGDHGWQLGDLGEFGKKTNFERATRTPLIIRDPSISKKVGTASALVEFVDIMPTIIDLAGLPSLPQCPASGSQPDGCVEGSSLRPVMTDPVGTHDWREAAFMQYATCMHDEKIWHSDCMGETDPEIMGYAMRTRRWRYIEWVRFNKSTASPLWDDLLGTELYDHTEADTVENVAESANVVMKPELVDVVASLSKQLREGWRASGTRPSAVDDRLIV